MVALPVVDPNVIVECEGKNLYIASLESPSMTDESSQSSDWSRLEAWDPSTSYDSSHGETRVGRAGLRIED